MKRRQRMLMVAIALAVFVVVGMSYAWLIDASNSLRNDFIVGDIQITLTESTGSTYILTPGTDLHKDPRVTVKAGSESCWLYVLVNTPNSLEPMVSYALSAGWTPLNGTTNVYYRAVEVSQEDQSFPVLLEDRVTVRDTVTEQQLNSLSGSPVMTFYAYAIQQTQIDEPERGWQEILAAQEQRNEE